ncbi:MAG TPA: K+/H+ antiporter subunit F [Sulfurovum sp.]|nr:K+/H+ antiporter subunit F [Sulfurovum sp.]
MLEYIIIIAFASITIALVLNFYRLVVGPSSFDRILALDTAYINSIALIVLIGIYFDNPLYFEAALLIALMGFVGTISLSKYILRGDIIE